MEIDRSFLNVIVLSCGFMLVFTAFQTMSNIEKNVLESIHTDDPNFDGDAYTSLAIIYGVFATCNWLAPSFISVCGSRIAIITGCCCYALFVASFLWPHTALLYTVSAGVGVGAALIWTGHGQYLTENSDSETMSRNAGIFWAIFQSSLFIGNLFVYFKFTEKIEESVRTTVFAVLVGLTLLGTLVLTTLRKAPQRSFLGDAEGMSNSDREFRIPEATRERPLLAVWHALRDAFALFLTPKMLLLSFVFIFTGLDLTFFSVYSSSIGFTKAMGDERKNLVGLSGVFIGIGEVTGGAIFGIFATKLTKGCGSSPVVIISFVTHLVAFLSIYMNIPNAAPFRDVDDVSFLEQPSAVLAMFGSLTLGFGDACFNTQVYSILGTLFNAESAAAFALFKFCQSVAAAVSFAYSNVIGLHVQILILLVWIVLGTCAFVFVEFTSKSAKVNEESNVDSSFVEARNLRD